jgi:hypothetical protein
VPTSRAGCPPGLEHFSHEDLIKFGEMLKNGEMPPELAPILGGAQNANPGYDKDGKPVIDSEGGAVVQPTPGFVVKT